MTERLHVAAAVLALLAALAVGCAHTPRHPADPSYDPSNAVPYREDP